MGGKLHEMLVTLKRDSPTEQWGFSLVGGSDVNAPLIVTRVGFHSPADGVLQRGDIITKVGNYDSRDIRHEDAQNLFSNAGNTVRVVVQRDASAARNRAAPGSAGSSHHTYSPLSVSPHLSPRGTTGASPYSPGAPALQPYYSLPFTPLDHFHYSVDEQFPTPKKDTDGDIHVVNQPYRTTPLVLPGAKVKKDVGHTESYLRHHPNPNVRAPPSHHIIDHDQYFRHKIVHKQFNSPINLYSEPNIADTVYKQAGIPAARKIPTKYNPEDSETYKAVREESYGGVMQEVSSPAQTRIFAPNRVPPAKKPGPVYSLPQKQTNPLGESEEIHQSGSFKRLMWSVMDESNF
ncbi:PREDICTED: PDZ and LIM domain protein 3 isoform X2 [Nicrophorus vespilloides]|uniref:PDZ and LIM domain protein 3 isoform X2 n=1 Tax=Nicrophorus vespilloides TaxID=110193 RepID=A0ABM1M0B4_NICVS|nr:PREDICTED: PDZ and LIM domain protein 3 isoform X2 [Nicrophorus vespilloides]